jgi:hypothetical protein
VIPIGDLLHERDQAIAVRDLEARYRIAAGETVDGEARVHRQSELVEPLRVDVAEDLEERAGLLGPNVSTILWMYSGEIGLNVANTYGVSADAYASSGFSGKSPTGGRSGFVVGVALSHAAITSSAISIRRIIAAA